MKAALASLLELSEAANLWKVRYFSLSDSEGEVAPYDICGGGGVRVSS